MWTAADGLDLKTRIMVNNGYDFPQRLIFDVLTINHLYIVVKHQDVLHIGGFGFGAY